MKIKYIRVSTANQNVDRQRDEKLVMYIEKCSGRIPFFERPIAQKLITDINKGIITEVEFHAVERIGRNANDSLKVIEYLEKKNIQVKITTIGISLFLDNNVKNPSFGIIAAILSSLAQSEVENMESRQREGIQIAKIRGVYKGRKAGAVQTDEQLLARHNEVVRHLKLRKNSLREVALLTQKSVNTVQKVKKILIEKGHYPIKCVS